MQQGRVILIRHARSLFNESEMQNDAALGLEDLPWLDKIKNEQLCKNTMYNPKFMDAPLSETGRQQCLKAYEILKDEPIDLVLVTPLQRVLETCSHVFKGREVRVVVEPLLAQSCRFACDGVRAGSLQVKIQKYPHYDFSKVEEQITYNVCPERIKQFHQECETLKLCTPEQVESHLMAKMQQKHLYESNTELIARTTRIRALIKQYSKHYKNIAVVSHWHVIGYLICKDFTPNGDLPASIDPINCQPYFYTLDQFLSFGDH